MTPNTKLTPRKDFGISRQDDQSRSTHAWRVRLDGQAQTFSDSIYGSKRKSQEAAENYRDQIWRSMEPKRQKRGAMTP